MWRRARSRMVLMSVRNGWSGMAGSPSQGSRRTRCKRRARRQGAAFASGGAMDALRRVWRGLGRLGAAWSEDRCARRAAAVSYYTAFSLAPILVIVLAVAGLIVETTTLSDAILDQARMLIGEAGAELLAGLLEAS